MVTEVFNTGDRVSHPTFGFGTITEVNADDYLVSFDNGRNSRIKMGYLSRVEPGDEVDTGWPDSTFFPEPEDTPHFLGSHWQAFVDDTDEILGELPSILPKCLQQTGYGDIYLAPKKKPDSWREAIQLVWPLRVHGLSLVIATGKSQNELVSVFPFYSSGIQQTLTLNEVTVWQSGVEAQITASWGESVITFFDSQFVINRAWYQADRQYEFILTGIAYEAGPAEETEFEVEMRQEVLDAINNHREPNEEPLVGKQTFSLKGAAMFLNVSGWDKDDYNFRGQIKTVEPMKEWLGQQGWKVIVTVMRFDDEDADLAILITEKAWQGKEPPKVG